jgi:hypothetical protein
MIGSNGKYFIILGTDYVHSYLIAENGAIKQQESQINTQLYQGGDCGTTGGALLDHTGANLYVLLNNAFAGGSGVCTAYQSFSLEKSSGALTFIGAATFDGRFAYQSNLPTITANDTFAYAVTAFGGYTPDVPMSGLKRASGGTLDWWSFTQTEPSGRGSNGENSCAEAWSFSSNSNEQPNSILNRTRTVFGGMRHLFGFRQATPDEPPPERRSSPSLG